MKNWLKILGLIALVAVIGFGMIACGDGGGTKTTKKDPVAVTGVSLPPTLSVEIGETKTLTPTITPDNATNKNVTWESEDTAIATVDNSGVTGVSAGSTKITVKTVDGNKTAECTVTVLAAANPDDITYDMEQDGGILGTDNSTHIVFTFNEDIDSFGLTAADIAVTGAASKAPGATLTGSGTTRTLPITVTAGTLPEEEAKVTITKAGIDDRELPVTVYRDITPTGSVLFNNGYWNKALGEVEVIPGGGNTKIVFENAYDFDGFDKLIIKGIDTSGYYVGGQLTNITTNDQAQWWGGIELEDIDVNGTAYFDLTDGEFSSSFTTDTEVDEIVFGGDYIDSGELITITKIYLE